MIIYIQSKFDGHWREIDDGLPELASPKARPPLANQRDIFADFIEQALEQDMRGEEHTMEEYMMGQEGNPDDGSL